MTETRPIGQQWFHEAKLCGIEQGFGPIDLWGKLDKQNKYDDSRRFGEESGFGDG